MAHKRLTPKSIRTLERIESNYKLIYTIIMSAPLILAMEILLVKQNPITGMLQFKNVGDFQISDFVIFILYLFFYTRFFLGDLRYLDLKYLESQNDESYLERYSPFSRFIDFFSLIIHAIFFYALAAAVTNVKFFYNLTLIILLLNSIWLLLIYLITDPANRRRVEMDSSLRWCLNNLVCFWLLALLLPSMRDFSGTYPVLVLALVLGLNSLVDFSLAWKMYFPKIKDEIIENNK